VRQLGEAAIRQSIEALRSADGDAATDAALAEIDEAVAHIAAESAFTALDEAVGMLSLSIQASRQSVKDSKGSINIGPDGDGPAITLLEAAENVRNSWDHVLAATTSTES